MCQQMYKLSISSLIRVKLAWLCLYDKFKSVPDEQQLTELFWIIQRNVTVHVYD